MQRFLTMIALVCVACEAPKRPEPDPQALAAPDPVPAPVSEPDPEPGPDPAPASPPAETWHGHEVRRLAPDGDGPVVVLFHGYGAPPDDLVPLAELLASRLPPGTRFFLPAGELRLPNGGRGHFAIGSLLQREAEAARGERDLSRETPDGLPEARALSLDLLAAIRRELGVAASRLAIGGFSQGAMVALDAALRSDEPPALVFSLSGTLVAEREWSPRMRAHGQRLRVFLSHGRRDPILPFAMTERLCDRLTDAGAAVEFVPFDGVHEIPMPVIEALASALGRALGPPAEPVN